MRIKIKVKPNSRRNEIKKLGDNHYEIRVTVPPEKGKANEKMLEILAKYLKLPKSRMKIIRGAASREKLIEVFNP